MKKIRIVSDGLSTGTKVYCDGAEIGGITKIEILPLVAGDPEFVSARLTFGAAELDITAKQITDE